MRCSVVGLFQRLSLRRHGAASLLAMTALYDVQMNFVGIQHEI